MKLELVRKVKTGESTIGILSIDGKFECYTLEDVVRVGEKIYGQTAIPTGTYKVILTMSPRFKRVLPLIVDVPGFDGIRIHPGNTAKDTDGCILVGTSSGKDVVNNSRVAFEALYSKLLNTSGITITIS
jgi:hypothetical protein